MNKNFLVFSFILAITASSMSASFSVEVKKTYEKSFAMPAGGQVTVQGDEGFIKVNSWDRPEVHLIWTKRVWARNNQQAEELLELVEVRINQAENNLQVKVVEPRYHRDFNFWDLFDPDTWGGSRYRSPVVDFALTVPHEINVDLANDEGDVSLKSIEGDVAIDVDEGDIDIADISFNDLDLSADEGHIRGSNLKSERGTIRITIDEGKVDLEEIKTSRLRLEGDESDVTFKNFQCGSCNISADEGEIEIDVLLQEDSRYDLATDEGDILLYLPDQPNVRFNLESQDGGIHAEFALKISKRDEVFQCRDSLGSGSSLIKAFADEGVISIKKR